MIKRNQKFKLLTALFICVILIISIFLFAKLRSVNGTCGKYCEIEPSMLLPCGYSMEAGVYTNVAGDAQMQLLGSLNDHISNVVVFFFEPLPQPINITVYYAAEGHGYSDGHTASVNVAGGSKEAILFVNADVTTFRIDISTNIGETFSLEKIVLNDGSIKNLEIFTTVLWFISIYIAAVLLFVIILFSISVERRFAIAALAIGFMYLLVITPLSPPDEPHHYQSSYQLSNYLLLQWKNAEQGNSAHFDYSNLVGHQNVESGYRRIMEDIGLKDRDGEQIEIPSPRDLSYFVEYLPQAVGISAARLLKLNFIWIFILGRVFNLLFYSLCLYVAVKRAPRFKVLLGLTGIFPMALHQAASFSYDGFINGMSLVLISSLLKAIYEEGPLSSRDYRWILISGMLLAPAKIVYAPILLLAFLIPKQRFSGTREQIRKTVGLFVVCSVSIAVFQIQNIVGMSGLDTASELNWEGQYNYTVSYILGHPLSTVKIFWNSFAINAEDWFVRSIGASLSGLTLSISKQIIWGFCGLTILSAFEYENSQFVLSGKCRAVFLISVGIVTALIMLSMFLGWTSNTRQIIQGVQGRYFIPILPLLFMSCSTQAVVLRKPVEKFCICSAILLHTGVIYQILAATCSW